MFTYLLRSQAELTKLNFDLETQFTQLQETQPAVVREASRDSENSSSDEDDLWEEKNKGQAGSQAMEVDVVADRKLYCEIHLSEVRV